MNTPNGPEPHDKASEQLSSIERRREALRRIGRTGAAAGAASPLAALATGGRPWTRYKGGTKKVHASVSGCNSVMMSAPPTKECYGKSCNHYKYSYNLPVGCTGNGKFRDYFTCVGGTKDSNGVTYDPNNSYNGCLFHKSITTLCTNHQTSPECAWITAYCNAAALNPTCKYPYSSTQVKSLWTKDAATKSAALSFFRSYMMNG